MKNSSHIFYPACLVLASIGGLALGFGQSADYFPVITSTETNSGWVYLINGTTPKELTWDFSPSGSPSGLPASFGLSATLEPSLANSLLVRPLDYVDEISIETSQAVGSVPSGTITPFLLKMDMPDLPVGYEFAGVPMFELGRGAFPDSTLNYFKPLQAKDVATGQYVAAVNQLVVLLEYGKEYELAYQFLNYDAATSNVKAHCRYWIQPQPVSVQPAVVPEAATLVFVLIGGCGLGRRRR